MSCQGFFTLFSCFKTKKRKKKGPDQTASTVVPTATTDDSPAHSKKNLKTRLLRLFKIKSKNKKSKVTTDHSPSMTTLAEAITVTADCNPEEKKETKSARKIRRAKRRKFRPAKEVWAESETPETDVTTFTSNLEESVTPETTMTTFTLILEEPVTPNTNETSEVIEMVQTESKVEDTKPARKRRRAKRRKIKSIKEVCVDSETSETDVANFTLILEESVTPNTNGTSEVTMIQTESEVEDTKPARKRRRARRRRRNTRPVQQLREESEPPNINEETAVCNLAITEDATPDRNITNCPEVLEDNEMESNIMETRETPEEILDSNLPHDEEELNLFNNTEDVQAACNPPELLTSTPRPDFNSLNHMEDDQAAWDVPQSCTSTESSDCSSLNYMDEDQAAWNIWTRTQTNAGEGNEKKCQVVKSTKADLPRKHLFHAFKRHPITRDFCKFSNCFNNCWFNSSLQAVSHIKTVTKKIEPLDGDALVAISQIPASAEVFLTAVHNPGAHFAPSQLKAVLKRIGKEIPSLQIEAQNDIVDFMNPLLLWLDDCGVQSNIQIRSNYKCPSCTYTSVDKNNVGNMFYLPQAPGQSSCLVSLLNSYINEICRDQMCYFCFKDMERDISFDDADILTLYVPRHETNETRSPLRPNKQIYVPVKDRKEKYSLVSVICHEVVSSFTDHFYSYVFKDGQIIKANDEKIRISKNSYDYDIGFNGILFFYEKCKNNE